MTTARVEEISDQLSAIRDDLTYLRTHWRDVLLQAGEKRDEDLEQLRQTHQRELEEFDRCVREGIPVHYRTRAPYLLHMRRRQRAMVASKRYVEATMVKDEADLIKEREMAENWAKWLERAEAEKKWMKKRHEEKFFVREATWNRELQEMQRIAEREILHCMRSTEHLKGKISEREQFAVDVGWMQPEDAMASAGVTLRARTLKPTEPTQVFKQKRLVNKLLYSLVCRPKMPHSARC
jgi:hypothetical protein